MANNTPKTTHVPSTQRYINIAQIKNGIVVTKTGKLISIIEVAPINFALKSEDDQMVIIGQYQNFLNSLNFPVQIVIHSRKLDVNPYLQALEMQISNISNELLRLHSYDYIDFVRKLTQLSNIMDKKFYIVVGYEPQQITKTGVFNSLFGKKEQNNLTFKAKEWEKFTSELKERIQLVQTGLSSIGLGTIPLDTQKAIELFYSIYNPEEAIAEKLEDEQKLEAPIISTNLARDNATNEVNQILDGVGSKKQAVKNQAEQLQATGATQTQPPAGATPPPVAPAQTQQTPQVQQTTTK